MSEEWDDEVNSGTRAAPVNARSPQAVTVPDARAVTAAFNALRAGLPPGRAESLARALGRLAPDAYPGTSASDSGRAAVWPGRESRTADKYDAEFDRQFEAALRRLAGAGPRCAR